MPDGGHANRTGLPATLSSGLESLSGVSLSDVRVPDSQTSAIGAQAFTQTNGPLLFGENHRQSDILSHEVSHTVQQARGEIFLEQY